MVKLLSSPDCLGIEMLTRMIMCMKYFRNEQSVLQLGIMKSLIWKESHSQLNDNKSGSIERLTNLLRSLKRTK